MLDFLWISDFPGLWYSKGIVHLEATEQSSVTFFAAALQGLVLSASQDDAVQTFAKTMLDDENLDT